MLKTTFLNTIDILLIKMRRNNYITKDLLGIILTSESYESVVKAVNKEKKRLEELDKLAISLGFKHDNYYSPREKMIAENELNLNLSESRAPMSRVSVSH